MFLDVGYIYNLNAYKKDMSRFYDQLKKDKEARRNPEKPYFFVAPDILRKKVASY